MKIYDTGILSRKSNYVQGNNGNAVRVSALDDVYKELSILKELKNQYIMNVHEILNDPENEKIYAIMEYCEKGCILTLDPNTSTFFPT